MKILFFTGTGNSLWVAKMLSGALLSIPKLERENKYEIDSDVIGIVCPIYAINLPHLVVQYLSKATLKADYVFAVLTYGKLAGDAAYSMQQILTKNGNRLDYAANLLMLDNALPFFTMEEQLAELPQKNVEGQFAQIKQEIAARRHGVPRGKSIFKIMSATNHSRITSIGSRNASFNADKNYSVTDGCNGCGLCEKLCPVGNIKITDRPEWGSSCEGCLSCVHNCPESAIRVKGERGSARYRHPEVTVAELIKANSTKEIRKM